MTRGTLLIGAGMLLLAASLGGCGREVKAPSLDAAQQAFQQAQGYEGTGQLQNAEQSYLAAFAAAEAALKALVPGDKLLPEAEEIRSKSAEQLARIREELRKQEVTAGQLVVSTTRVATVKNLLPPVAPYAAPVPEKAPQPVGPAPEAPKPPDGTQPPTPTTPPAAEPPKTEPPKTEPPAGEPPKEAPKETPKATQDVRITKAVVKGKVILVYWTFSNTHADKGLTFGAPAGRVTTKGGGRTLLQIRETFDVNGFELNPDDVMSSKGKNCKPNAFTLQPGESREMVTVGVFGDEAGAKQAGAVVIELRMNEGEDLSDKFMDVTAG